MFSASLSTSGTPYPIGVSFVFLDPEDDPLHEVYYSVSATDDPVEATAAAVVRSRINPVRG